jgi:hypothetical protein
MRRMMIIVASLALVGIGAGAWLAVDISQHGALNTGGVERYPGANTVATVLSAAVIIGLLLMLVGVLLGLLHSVRHGQWGWFVLIVVLIPISLYGVLDASFTAHMTSAALSLLAPLALLSYSILQPKNTGRSLGGIQQDV